MLLQHPPLARQATKKEKPKAKARAKAKGSHLKANLGILEKAHPKAKGNLMSGFQKERE
jgi:hypothetical protein